MQLLSVVRLVERSGLIGLVAKGFEDERMSVEIFLPREVRGKIEDR